MSQTLGMRKGLSAFTASIMLHALREEAKGRMVIHRNVLGQHVRYELTEKGLAWREEQGRLVREQLHGPG